MLKSKVRLAMELADNFLTTASTQMMMVIKGPDFLTQTSVILLFFNSSGEGYHSFSCICT